MRGIARLDRVSCFMTHLIIQEGVKITDDQDKKFNNIRGISHLNLIISALTISSNYC